MIEGLAIVGILALVGLYTLAVKKLVESRLHHKERHEHIDMHMKSMERLLGNTDPAVTRVKLDKAVQRMNSLDALLDSVSNGVIRLAGRVEALEQKGKKRG